jgi:uncharacterized protein
MTLPLTSFYTALLTLLMLALSVAVIIKRGQTGISIMHGNNMELALASRRFGNFIEYVPMAMILLALMEVGGASSAWLHAAGSLTLAGRLLHALGLDAANHKAPLRIIGGSFTLLVLAIAAIWLLQSRFS